MVKEIEKLRDKIDGQSTAISHIGHALYDKIRARFAINAVPTDLASSLNAFQELLNKTEAKYDFVLDIFEEYIQEPERKEEKERTLRDFRIVQDHSVPVSDMFTKY